ncbi:MAG: dihydrolipoyl dehydrogenase [Myxococcales bacterium]|nr:dihydrolipoyl dehydrogenase [Myxococcales bacterium]MCB9530961.1 dihydrolipoyl dehydrogenase [Myxococcales bacterium]MCB9532881.1 dihydrolipoyl dehydrogenase [Myxococcales bacterium]
MATKYDVTVIGSGPGGYVAAVRCAQLGLKTAIVEKDTRLGGTCLLRGCIPTKALLESAHLYEKMQESSKFGIKAANVEVDFAGVQSFREKTVGANSKGVTFLMRKNKIDVISGHGRLDGPGFITVTAADGTVTRIESKSVILATGSVCKDLPFIEMDHVRTVNSDDILEIGTIPESLVVMGAGAVGTEFASVYRSFGSKVTLIEFMDHLLPIEDEDVSKELEKAYRRRGIECLTASKVTKVDLVDGGVRVHVEPRDGGAGSVIDAKMLLVAVGRAAVTGDVGLATVGITPDARGMIPVDDHCRTSQPGVYAIGDIIATPWLAHVASHEGVMVAEQIAGKTVHPINYGHTPNCTYCVPEVASVGLTERQARDKGYDVKTGSFPFSASGKARIMGEAEGMVKFVADAKHDELLGVHIIGPKATELIAELVVGLHLETTVEELAHAMHPHPTLAEAIGEAAHATLNGSPLNA